MQTPSAERAEAPDAFESQSDATGNDVHDHVPLSALRTVLAALLAREGANNKEQREKTDVRAKDCQRRFIGALRVVEASHAELEQKNISGPFLPILYRKANVDMAATPQQAATQRGGNEGKSVLVRGDAIYACIVKHVLPVARRTYTHRESGINWMDVSAAVSAHVDALLTAEPPLSKTDRELLSAAHYAWQWTCPENADVCASSTLSKHALMSFNLTKTLARPAEAYPQNRADQRSRKTLRETSQRGAVAAMRATDSAQKRRREQDELRTSLLKTQVLALLEEELLAMRAERLRESNPSDDRRVGLIASGATDSHARAGGLTFAERLERTDEEEASNQNADECATDVARATEPAMSPAQENVPVTTTQDEACVPSTDVTPACTPRRSARASNPNLRLQRV
ncbi:hypothetical protein BE221DRAFT_192917 [Ostreococcus tauri]|uniref:Uncharacterized protein n=1 Tax=Ostreococcus tauri TaxID=70448 RepID=A0A1Y5IF15_OSTTA|nr:hypothetical protein BE221DRAFT_192917 [Ostreococcus tauri]